MADDESLVGLMDEVPEEQTQPEEDEFVPPSIPEDVWHSTFFRQACTLEMVTLAEMSEVDKMQKQLDRLRKLLSERRLNEQEYADRVRQVFECEAENVDAHIETTKSTRDGLLNAVMETMSELERQEDSGSPFPVPSAMTIEEFMSKAFRDACELHGVTLATVSDTERIAKEAERLKRLLNNKRITSDEFHRNILSLTGHPPSALTRFMKERRKAEQILLSKIRKIVKDQEQRAAEDALAKEKAAKKKDAFLSKFKSQIEDAISKERAKADLNLARRRTRLQQLLVQRGIEQQLRLVKDADAQIAPETNLPKGTTSDKAFEFVSKGVAAVERKKLFLDHRTKKSRLNRVSSQGSEAGGVPAKVLAARGRREKMDQERLEMIDANHKDKMIAASQRMERQLEKREKLFAEARLKKEKRDQTVARMEWANMRRKEMLQNKIKEDDDRLTAMPQQTPSNLKAVDDDVRSLKELKTKQQIAIAEIQSQAIQKEKDLVYLIYKAENDANFNVADALHQFGVDLNMQQVDDHVMAHTSRLCAHATSITTPELPNANPDAVAKRHPGLRSRPFSAPPGGPSIPEHHKSTAESGAKSRAAARGRPATATARGWTRPVSGRLASHKEVAAQDEADGQLLEGTHSMQRLERLRVAQAKKLHHIVLEEQEYEKERLAMRNSIQPGQRTQLDRLFERERQVASDRILRAAAENEMAMLQEMAQIAAEEEAAAAAETGSEFESELSGRRSSASELPQDLTLDRDASAPHGEGETADSSQLEPPSLSPVLPGPAHSFSSDQDDVGGSAEDETPSEVEASASALGDSAALLDDSAASERYPAAPPGAL